jgi:hypothetical protein
VSKQQVLGPAEHVKTRNASHGARRSSATGNQGSKCKAAYKPCLGKAVASPCGAGNAGRG